MNIEEGGVYLHKKSEAIYTVLHLAKEEATEEAVVVYQRTNHPNMPIWVRPLDQFKEKFEREEF